ncbi:MAG: ATP-binding domain-containing protein [Gammaproteobacteria bacterium]|nr:ATP-binding domain-containing protein [Gammaproteobacteria bacterium]
MAGISDLASYRSPYGQLASTPAGSGKDIPGFGYMEVVERSLLHPQSKNDIWDSKNSLVEAESAGRLTITSFRNVLLEEGETSEVEDILGQMLAEETQKSNIVEGLRRSVITKMGLRDQPILDEFQDEIFRLPINSNLLLLGPAGTGKTTTLIRRLGQKLDEAYLDESEKAVVGKAVQRQGFPHSRSWLMFTPTELLKHYLKEAFAREGIPATDQSINTWDHYRRYIARDVLSVLKTSAGTGSFILREESENLLNPAINDAELWHEDFSGWQKQIFLQELSKAAAGLNQGETDAVRDIGFRLIEILDKADAMRPLPLLRALVGQIDDVRQLRADLKQSTDVVIKKSLNLQLVENTSFLDELGSYIETLGVADDPEEDEEEDDVEDDDGAAPSAYSQRLAASKAYTRAMRSYARSLARKRLVKDESRTGKLLAWLGSRVPNEDQLLEVGQSLIIQSYAAKFVNPVKGYLNGIPRRYRVFRRTRQQEEVWYRQEKIAARDLDPLELDIILLSMLQGSRLLASDKQVARDLGSSAWSALDPYLGLFRHQILVDEAADFSPVQIACIVALADPGTNSFFACGDFNQRLTRWGSRSVESLKWACPDIKSRRINVTYRQTKQLNNLAHEIITAVGGADDVATLPPGAENDGVDPVLLEGTKDIDALTRWLASRIREIENFVGQLPSIAVFVNGEDQVGPVAQALKTQVVEDNIPVVPCPNGQIIGQENEVRVFDIQHIKGLEFEAAFFIAIDQLALKEPELFDKYLYVGTTRAATYLGITCETKLPPQISELSRLFTDSWARV